MIAVLEIKRLVDDIHHRIDGGQAGRLIQIPIKTLRILQQQLECRFRSDFRRFPDVLPPDAAYLPVGMTEADVESTGIVLCCWGKQHAGDVGVVGVNAVLQAHLGGNKVLSADAKKSVNASAYGKHLQRFVEREPELRLNQGPCHPVPDRKSTRLN